MISLRGSRLDWYRRVYRYHISENKYLLDHKVVKVKLPILTYAFYVGSSKFYFLRPRQFGA